MWQNHKIKNQEGKKKTLELSLEYLAKYGYKSEIKYKF
jgi:hypothetical protein